MNRTTEESGRPFAHEQSVGSPDARPFDLHSDAVQPALDWSFGLRFPEPMESEFRADYRRIFVGRMQVMWAASAIAWLAQMLADAAFFHEAAPPLRPIRIAALVILVATALATLFGERIGRRLNALTAVTSAAVGCGTVALFVMVPYPASLPLYWSLAGLLIVTTIFFSTLHY